MHKYLGSYRSEAEAHTAYVKASQQMHGGLMYGRAVA